MGFQARPFNTPHKTIFPKYDQTVLLTHNAVPSILHHQEKEVVFQSVGPWK